MPGRTVRSKRWSKLSTPNGVSTRIQFITSVLCCRIFREPSSRRRSYRRSPVSSVVGVECVHGRHSPERGARAGRADRPHVRRSLPHSSTPGVRSWLLDVLALSRDEATRAIRMARKQESSGRLCGPVCCSIAWCGSSACDSSARFS